jgi:hypothetical protein
MQEAINRGVPLLGIPIFGDQSMNMAKAVSAGYGVVVEIGNATEDSLTWAISEILENHRYVLYIIVIILTSIHFILKIRHLKSSRYWIVRS